MKISVCIITLNEEKVIERLLNCVKSFANEIIIVDTGSNDNTISIARKFTDKVYNFTWEDDFSKARNYAFSFAKCDYLMWLDADDYITNDNVCKINKLKEVKQLKDTYMFKYSCFANGEKTPSLTFYRERLLKNCNKCRFVGFVHEVIVPFGEVEFTDIEIEHRKVDFNYSKRNLNIYRKHSFNSLSSRDKYYCAKEYYYNGYYKSAIAKLKLFLKDATFLPNIYDTYLTLFDCYDKLGDKNACKYLYLCIDICGISSEILCKLGDYYLNKKAFEKAIGFYKCALNCDKVENSLSFIKNEYYYLYPLLQLTLIYNTIGDVENSIKFHKKCLMDSPNDLRVLSNDKIFNAKQK